MSTATDNGMPDLERQRICRRCGRWFDIDELDLAAPESRFARSYLVGTGSVFRFQCRRCTRVRMITQRAIWGTFGAMLLLVWSLVRLGVIK